MVMEIEDLTPEILALVPGIKSIDLLNLLRIREAQDGKFAAAAFTSRPGHVAHDIARSYAHAYSGTFAFMIDMKRNEMTGRLKPSMTAGVINSLWNDISGIRIRANVRPVQYRAVERVLEDGDYVIEVEEKRYRIVIATRVSSEHRTQIVKIPFQTDPKEAVRVANIGFLKGDKYVPFSAYTDLKFAPYHAAITDLVGKAKENAMDSSREAAISRQSGDSE